MNPRLSTLRRTALAPALLLAACAPPALAQAPLPAAIDSSPVPAVQTSGTSAAAGPDAPIVEAREALRKRDRARLAALRASTAAAQHPLAMWVDYWELGNRLTEAQQPELDAFYARWKGTYVEDRLRNDWLLELGKRRDWANFARDMPAFRMNDDREVTCYHLLTQHLAGQDVRDAARAAWFAQRDADDGCQLLGSTLYKARQLQAQDVWREAELSVEANRPRAARAAAALINPVSAQLVADLWEQPLRVLKRLADEDLTVTRGEIATLALMRAAALDLDAAAQQLTALWQRRLSPAQASLAWAAVGKQAALKLLPDAAEHYARAMKLAGSDPLGWSDDTLAWAVRAALRSAPAGERWPMIQRAIDAMSAEEQRDSAWLYWKARAVQGRAKAGADGEADRAAARNMLEALSRQMNFYGKLATEDLGQRVSLPAPAASLTDAEREAARGNPGLQRGLRLIGAGLRNEGVREWNWTLRGMPDRELLAAAQVACDREVWDRCINTSDRTRGEIDMAQRFPTPFRAQVVAKAREINLDPAYVYGLIRQESRFIMDTRSHVGASGLMQLMPATARWTAKRAGLPDFRLEQINDRDINLRLGTTYLKLVLDDFGGSQALAAAAYNAGPNRPRRWREGAVMEPAAWAETIPFNETRDYVKKVLSNAVYYGAVLGAPAPSLKARLGGLIGPRDAAAPVPNREIP